MVAELIYPQILHVEVDNTVTLQCSVMWQGILHLPHVRVYTAVQCVCMYLYYGTNINEEMKSTKVQTLGGNIGTFGLETPICMHMY